MKFASPYFLLLLGFLPLLVWRLTVKRRKVYPIFLFSWTKPLAGAPQGLWHQARHVPLILRLLGILLIIIALARPQQFDQKNLFYAQGIDIVIVLDISTSMKAIDFQPKNRLHVAKEVIGDFIASRKNDRIGLVVFAGEAFTQCPLTLDYSILYNILQAVRMDVIKDGTAIGDALANSLNRLRDSQAKSKMVILLTDGENNSGNIEPLKAAAFAKELEIEIFPILVGKGGMVPYPVGKSIFGRQQYQQVEIPVNPKLLKEIASATNGKFYQAADRQELNDNFNDLIDKMETSKLPEQVYGRPQELYLYFVMAALYCLLLEFIILRTRLERYP